MLGRDTINLITKCIREDIPISSTGRPDIAFEPPCQPAYLRARLNKYGFVQIVLYTMRIKDFYRIVARTNNHPHTLVFPPEPTIVP